MRFVPNAFYHRPFTAESDLAGIVVSSSSPDLKHGDRIFGLYTVNFNSKFTRGLWTNIPACLRPPLLLCLLIYPSPKRLGLPWMTTVQGLMHWGKLEEGQSVFIMVGAPAAWRHSLSRSRKPKDARLLQGPVGKMESSWEVWELMKW